MSTDSILPTAAGPRRPGHWVVRMNHRNRTTCYLVMAPLMGLHLASQDPGLLAWFLWAATFLGFPQAAWLWASRSPAPLRAEILNMRLDALLLGAWTAGLQFPLWVAFVVFTGAVQNLLLFRGPRGFLDATAWWLVGAAALGALNGWAVQPETGPAVTALAALSLTLYLAVSGADAWRRAMSLHETREQLRASERELKQRLEEIEMLQARLREQALRDALTGLYNRHHLGEALAQTAAVCARNGQPLSLMVIDIDHFKRINDTWGHPAGDAVLRELAARLREHVRGGDLLFRHGGEEFLVVMPQADAEGAFAKAELLRSRIADPPVPWNDTPLPCTASIGVATLQAAARVAGQGAQAPDPARIEGLISRADEALYRAKTGGRNRVCQAEESPSGLLPRA